MTAVAIVIPARNEQQLIGACLTSVQRALAAADTPGVIVVVAHRCTDDTAARARQLLHRGGLVIEDSSAHVSGARRAGVRAALSHFTAVRPGDLWLFSTDADTVVPLDWVVRVLHHARARGAAAVAGLADLDAYDGLPVAARRAYRDLVAAGIDHHTHRHAYAANLAVRADAYLEVGGWPAVVNGEEHALLAGLEGLGVRVHRPVDVVVVTSPRQRARATGGLGDLLAELVATEEDREAS